MLKPATLAPISFLLLISISDVQATELTEWLASVREPLSDQARGFIWLVAGALIVVMAFYGRFAALIRDLGERGRIWKTFTIIFGALWIVTGAIMMV